MKIWQTLIVLSFLLLFAQAQEPCSNPETLITLSDANLETVILEKLNLNTITCQDIQSLTELNAQRADIRSLEGLEHAVNLSDLRLNTNQISDIQAIANLTQLNRLWLNSNNLDDVDLGALAGLTQLEDLRLGNNKIQSSSSLIQLISMSNLKILHLQNNNLASLNMLSSMKSLRDVSVAGNPLTQTALETLRLLPNLTALTLSDLNLNDMNFVTSLFPNPDNATLLVLHDNQISDISPLQALPNLRHLHIARNPIEDFSYIQNLESLTNLTLSDTNFTNFEALKNLSQLTWLSIQSNALQDVSGLLDIAGLQEGSSLFLQNNCIAEDDPAIAQLQEKGVNIQLSLASDCTN